MSPRGPAPVTARPATGIAPATGRRARVTGTLAFLGPAFVAGIAYVDPGNVATNFEAGSRFGYTLLWVVVVANAVAAFIQALSAKAGLATGRDIAQLCRERFPAPVTRLLWLQAEAVAVATDLAEVVGGALALYLLAGVPLPVGAVVTAVAAYLLLMLRDRGYRPFEVAVALLFLVIAAGFCVDLVAARPDPGELVTGLVPSFAGGDSMVLATAMVGATVMPHAIYLHSALTGRRSPPGSEISPRRALRLQRLDIGVAMGAAGVVNASMVVIAAAALPGVAGGIPGFHSGLVATVGGFGAFCFVVALLASGLASSGVGTLSGEVIMAGHLQRRVPRVVRRAVTLAPALILLWCGVGATDALIVSQLVLGFGVPFVLGVVILITRDRAVMGELVNRRSTTVLAVGCALAVAGIDLYSIGSVVL